MRGSEVRLQSAPNLVPAVSRGIANPSWTGVVSGSLRHWSVEHALIATAVAVLTAIATYISAGQGGVNFPMLALGIIWIGLFSLCFTLFTQTAGSLSETKYIRRLFGYALVMRLLAVVLVYAVFQMQYGSAFEPYANDSVHYHQAAVEFAESISRGSFAIPPGISPSDFGYIALVGTFYFVFGASILGLRVAQALIGAWTAVLLYRVCKLSVGEGVARTVGALCAFYPYYVYYVGLHLKETVMISLIVCVFFLTVKISQSRHKLMRDILLLVASLGALFFFRTFVAVLMVGCVCVHLFVQTRSGARLTTRVLATLGIIGGIGFVVFDLQPVLSGEVLRTWQRAAGQWDRELRDKENRVGISINKDLVSQPAFVALAATGPLPNLVKIAGQENGVIQYGFAWVRYLFALFAFSGVYLTLRYYGRSLAVVLLFLFGYIFVLGIAGLANSHRFQLPTLAPWILLTGLGLHSAWKRKTLVGFWMASLFLIAATVVYWNYLKIAVRI